MKIRRRAHPINPTIGTTRPRPGGTGTTRLPTRNRMGASMDWPLYNASGELIDRAAIQAKVVEQTAANRAAKGSSSPVEAVPTPATSNAITWTLEVADEVLRLRQAKPAKAIPDSALARFKVKYGKAPWYIKAKGSTENRDSIYLTADSGSKDGEIPTSFEGVQVRITYVQRGRR